jgi:hypothetical protein
VRRLAAVGLVLGAVLAAVLAWFTLSMLFAPLVFAGTMAFALAAPRAGRTIAVLLLATAGTATGAGALAAQVDPRGCRDFRFDPERWQRALASPDDDRESAPSERLAAAVVRCRTVAGATRDEVRAALGEPTHVGARGWTWAVGLTNDGIGPGDTQELSVRFAPDGRVRAAELTYE